MNNTILRARDIHKTYRIGPSNPKILRGASLNVRSGEFVAIKGASGSGKSTLLHILGALDVPDRGDVVFNGQTVVAPPRQHSTWLGSLWQRNPLGRLVQLAFDSDDKYRAHYRNREVGFVFQFFHLLPELNVLENVMMPCFVRFSLSAWPGQRKKAREDAEAILDRVGLSHRLNHRPAEVSGGERQRVAIARALVNRPALLLADEPTGNLDATIGADIMELLSGLNKSGQTIVMVTHDPNVSGRAHRCLRLADGRLHDIGTAPGGRETTDAAESEVVR